MLCFIYWQNTVSKRYNIYIPSDCTAHTTHNATFHKQFYWFYYDECLYFFIFFCVCKELFCAGTLEGLRFDFLCSVLANVGKPGENFGNTGIFTVC